MLHPSVTECNYVLETKKQTKKSPDVAFAKVTKDLDQDPMVGILQVFAFFIFFPTYMYRHNMLTEALLFLQEKWIADYKWFHMNKRLQ